MGRATAAGEAFTVDDQLLVRVSILADPAKGGRGRPGLIWADDASGRRRNLNFEEDNSFWGWALIEVLRHRGVRIEELTELDHRSFVAYTLQPTGEVIPLLLVTTSRTDARVRGGHELSPVNLWGRSAWSRGASLRRTRGVRLSPGECRKVQYRVRVRFFGSPHLLEFVLGTGEADFEAIDLAGPAD